MQIHEFLVEKRKSARSDDLMWCPTAGDATCFKRLTTMWCHPNVINWFVNPINYRYITNSWIVVEDLKTQELVTVLAELFVWLFRRPLFRMSILDTQKNFILSWQYHVSGGKNIYPIIQRSKPRLRRLRQNFLVVWSSNGLVAGEMMSAPGRNRQVGDITCYISRNLFLPPSGKLI
jgi:hypothetical protein